MGLERLGLGRESRRGEWRLVRKFGLTTAAFRLGAHGLSGLEDAYHFFAAVCRFFFLVASVTADIFILSLPISEVLTRKRDYHWAEGVLESIGETFGLVLKSVRIRVLFVGSDQRPLFELSAMKCNVDSILHSHGKVLPDRIRDSIVGMRKGFEKPLKVRIGIDTRLDRAEYSRKSVWEEGEVEVAAGVLKKVGMAEELRKNSHLAVGEFEDGGMAGTVVGRKEELSGPVPNLEVLESEWPGALEAQRGKRGDLGRAIITWFGEGLARASGRRHFGSDGSEQFPRSNVIPGGARGKFNRFSIEERSSGASVLILSVRMMPPYMYMDSCPIKATKPLLLPVKPFQLICQWIQPDLLPYLSLGRMVVIIAILHLIIPAATMVTFRAITVSDLMLIPPCHHVALGGGYPVHYAPPPHYSMELPRYEYDKNMPRSYHCYGCPNHPYNSEEKQDHGKDNADMISVKDQRSEDGKRQFPFPIIWMPAYEKSLKKLKRRVIGIQTHLQNVKKSSHTSSTLSIPVIQIEPHKEEDSEDATRRGRDVPVNRPSSTNARRSSSHPKRLSFPLFALELILCQERIMEMEPHENSQQDSKLEEGISSSSKEVQLNQKEKKLIKSTADASNKLVIEKPMEEEMNIRQRRIQKQAWLSAYRGFDVRMGPLKKLKQIAEIREQLVDVRNHIQTLESSSDLQKDNKQKVLIGESIMRLLLKLDAIQGLHSSLRDIRKSLARELVNLQEKLDSLMIGNSKESEVGWISKRSKSLALAILQCLPVSIVQHFVAEDDRQKLSIASDVSLRQPDAEPLEEPNDVVVNGEPEASTTMVEETDKADAASESIQLVQAPLVVEDKMEILRPDFKTPNATEFDKDTDVGMSKKEVQQASEQDSTSEVISAADFDGAPAPGKDAEVLELVEFPIEVIEDTASSEFEKNGQVELENDDLLMEDKCQGATGATPLEVVITKSEHPNEVHEDSNIEPEQCVKIGCEEDEEHFANLVLEGLKEGEERAEVSNNVPEPEESQLKYSPEEKETKVDIVGAKEELKGFMMKSVNIFGINQEEGTETQEKILTTQSKTRKLDLVETNEKLKEENEKLRKMTEKLMEAGKEQLDVISNLTGRVKDLEKKLSKKKKLRTRQRKSGVVFICPPNPSMHIFSLTSNDSQKQYTIKLNNKQTWLDWQPIGNKLVISFLALISDCRSACLIQTHNMKQSLTAFSSCKSQLKVSVGELKH
ncbi:hypothetical protein FNV43_RR01198 [Rhamnella rubrinervis]|uniref:BAG domain-containing protein n=1 Tax=Rhamnella rubrinervis TaxID=2594499 RepID=A0A8K0MT42_9ROSA|nr:hypothetical protein FNV43_RR01198 [Rhamnella rubrinervis]